VSQLFLFVCGVGLHGGTGMTESGEVGDRRSERGGDGRLLATR